jgi:hypothetical protein
MNKEQAREEAIQWQITQSNKTMSWQEIAEKAQYFRKIGKKYGLLREFKINGII